MTTESIDIVFRERGVVDVKNKIDDLGKTTYTTEGYVNKLKSALLGLGIGLGLKQLNDHVEAWARFNGRIRNATRSQAEFNNVQRRLFAIAQSGQQSIEVLSETYGRVSAAAKELGYDQDKALKFTDALSKTLSAAQVPASAASGALVQLGQALSGGTFRAQEFNSVLEGAPALLQTAANHIKGVDGSIGKLRNMMLEGKLSAQIFFDAMIKGGESLGNVGGGTVRASSAFVALNNAMTKFVGELDSAIGTSGAFGGAILAVARNFTQVASAAIGAGAAIALAFVPAQVEAMRLAVLRLWAVVRAHPFALIATAVGGMLGYFHSLRNELTLTKDTTTTLGTLLSVVFDDFKTSVSEASATVGEFASDTASSVKGTLTTIGAATKQEIDNWSSSYSDFFTTAESGWFGVVRVAARSLDALSALVQGSIRAVAVSFTEIPYLITNAFKDGLNSVNGLVESAINGVVSSLNSILSTFGGRSIDLVKLTKFEVDKNYFSKTGREIALAFEDGFSANAGFAERWLDSVVAKANTVQIELDKVAKASSSQSTTKTSVQVDSQAIKAAQDAYAKLVAELDPVREATRKYKEEQSLLNRMLAKGTDAHTKYSAALNDKYADAINPLAALNRELTKQIQLAGLTAKSREIEAQLIAHVNDLRSKGVRVTEAETDAIRQQLTVLKQATDMRSLQDELLKNTQSSKQQSIADQLAAAGAAGLQGQDLTGAVNGIFNIFPDEDGFLSQLNQLQEYQAVVEQMRQADLENAQVYSAAKVALQKQESQLKLQAASNFFGAVAQLQGSQSKKLARIGKAAALSEAMINVYTAATKAYAQGGIYGAATSASVISAGLGIVNQIRSMRTEGFMTGGSFKVGGSGGADSQMVAFRATPGEQVTVSTPTQVRKGTDNVVSQNDPRAATITPKIVNVLDPALVGDFLNTDAGEQIVMNIIQRNQGALSLG